MENKFVTDVVNLIQNKNAKKSIQAELESHILDKADYYMEIGYSKDEAFKSATEEMGDAEETAVPLNGIHSTKWYKSLWNIVTVIFIILVLLLRANIIPIYNRFLYGDFSYQISHSISIDFISTIILGAFILLIYKSYKHKIMLIPILLTILLITFPLVRPYEMTIQAPLFEPALYSLITIFSKGFNGYIDSTFGYSYIPNSNKDFLDIGSVIILIILILTSVSVAILIFRKQRMKSTKHFNLPIKSTIIILTVFYIANLVCMIFGTICGVMNLPNKLNEMLYAKQEQLSYIINADPSISTRNHTDTLMNNGYENYFDTHSELYNMGCTALHKGNDYNMIYTFKNDDSFQLTYATTLFDNRLSMPYYSLKITENEISQISENMTLDDFISLGWYDKVITATCTKGNDVTIDFMFLAPDKDGLKTYNLNFIKNNNNYILTGHGYIG